MVGRRVTVPTHISVGIVGSFLILAVGALYYARSFFLPLILALLITLTLAPLVRRLANRGIPPVVAAAAMVLVLGGGLVAGSIYLTEPVSGMLAEAPEAVNKVRERFAFLRQPFTLLNEAGGSLQKLAEGDTGATEAPERVVVMQPGLIGWAAGTAAGIGTTLGATLILTLFLLVSRDALRLKLVRVMPDLSDKKRSLKVLRDIENEVSRYLLTITAINAGLGAGVGIAMAVLGMPNPILWGIGAALLNFIPFVGGFVGMALTVAVAAITYPTLGQAALPPLAYLALQMIEGNLVTPTVLGRRLELNPVAILVFLSLTTWMWGIIGAIIGVPLMVVVKAFSDNFPTLAPLGEFLSHESPPTEEDETTPTPIPFVPAGVAHKGDAE